MDPTFVQNFINAPPPTTPPRTPISPPSRLIAFPRCSSYPPNKDEESLLPLLPHNHSHHPAPPSPSLRHHPRHAGTPIHPAPIPTNPPTAQPSARVVIVVVVAGAEPIPPPPPPPLFHHQHRQQQHQRASPPATPTNLARTAPPTLRLACSATIIALAAAHQSQHGIIGGAEACQRNSSSNSSGSSSGTGIMVTRSQLLGLARQGCRVRGAGDGGGGVCLVCGGRGEEKGGEEKGGGRRGGV